MMNYSNIYVDDDKCVTKDEDNENNKPGCL